MTEETKKDEKRPLEPAEIAKLEAEARKIEAEIKKTEAETEAARLTAETLAQKTVAEAELTSLASQEQILRMVEIQHNADRANEKRTKELAANEYHHIYRLSGGVDTASADKCLEQLKVWDRTEEPGKITIEFYSPGGSVLAGMALFDAIIAMRSRGWHFTTVCRGYAASMAGILLQAGDERVCGPESYVLIHEISSGAVGKIGELEDEVEFIKMIQNRVNDIFVKRSGGKVTSAKLRAMYRRKDFWLDSSKCLALGICDSIG